MLGLHHVLLETRNHNSRLIRLYRCYSLNKLLHDVCVRLLALYVSESNSEDDCLSKIVNACDVYLKQAILILSLLADADQDYLVIKFVNLKHIVSLDEYHHWSAFVQCYVGILVPTFYKVKVTPKHFYIELYVTFDHLESI